MTKQNHLAARGAGSKVERAGKQKVGGFLETIYIPNRMGGVEIKQL